MRTRCEPKEIAKMTNLARVSTGDLAIAAINQVSGDLGTLGPNFSKWFDPPGVIFSCNMCFTISNMLDKITCGYPICFVKI